MSLAPVKRVSCPADKLHYKDNSGRTAYQSGLDFIIVTATSSAEVKAICRHKSGELFLAPTTAVDREALSKLLPSSYVKFKVSSPR